MCDYSRVVRCHGCGGTGQHGPYHPLDFPRDCNVCVVGQVWSEWSLRIAGAADAEVLAKSGQVFLGFKP